MLVLREPACAAPREDRSAGAPAAVPRGAAGQGARQQLVVLICAPKEDTPKLLSCFLYRVRDNRAKCFKNPISTSFNGITDKFIIPRSVT